MQKSFQKVDVPMMKQKGAGPMSVVASGPNRRSRGIFPGPGLTVYEIVKFFPTLDVVVGLGPTLDLD